MVRIKFRLNSLQLPLLVLVMLFYACDKEESNSKPEPATSISEKFDFIELKKNNVVESFDSISFQIIPIGQAAKVTNLLFYNKIGEEFALIILDSNINRKYLTPKMYDFPSF